MSAGGRCAGSVTQYILLAVEIGSRNAGFPSGGFSCAEALLQSLNLAERLPAEESKVTPFSECPIHCPDNYFPALQG